MIRKDADDVIAFLNELLAIDEPFLRALISTRLPCNDDLAYHPTVQVSQKVIGQNLGFVCGFLGVLNGYLGVFDDGPKKGWGPITVTTDHETGIILKISKTVNEHDSFLADDP